MNLRNYWTLSLLLAALGGFAQPGWVFFTDKGAVDYSDQDPLQQSVHLPYLDSLRNLGMDVKGHSRWFNAAYVGQLNATALSKKSYVQCWRAAGNYRSTLSGVATDPYVRGFSELPLSMLGLDSFHRAGQIGGGVLVALFDGGFLGVDRFDAFQSMRESGRIYTAEDFVEPDSVYTSSAHGTAVLGLAGGWYADSLLGAAPGARFVLVRTEDVHSETHQEELNWVKAMEWADMLKVDLIHSSLGYSEFDSLQGDYTYADMDGNSTIITLAADVAAGRGMFITNSAGNQGDKAWKYITAPCDGFNVLCVGAVDSAEQHAAFSSYGPSADGRIKPEVMAMGKDNYVVGKDGVLTQGSGTSFSGPLIAGMVACLKQAHPGIGNVRMREAILRSCDRYAQPDSAYGYGIPNVVLADSLLSSDALSVAAAEADAWRLAPNPVSDHFSIKGIQGSVDYRLYRLDGVLMQEGSTQTSKPVQLHAPMKNGMYLLELSNGLYGKRMLLMKQ